MNIIPTTLGSQPGVQRDGTVYNSDAYTAAINTRFFYGWPTKMLGWVSLDPGNQEIVNSMFSIYRGQSQDIYLGRPSSLSFFNLTNTGTASQEIDRTPVAGFTPNPNNLWTYAQITTASSSQEIFSQIVASVAPNLSDITNEIAGPIFVGNTHTTDPLIQVIDVNTGPVLCSGPIISAFGRLIALSSNGNIIWCNNTDLTNWYGFQNIASTKLCAAILFQGSLLVWSLNTLYRLDFVPAVGDIPEFFNPQTLVPNISLWSANSITVYQNTIFWVGQNQFYQFTGVVGVVNNTRSNTWFFGRSGVNPNYKGKVFSFIDFQHQEWWILYPRGENSTNNNYAEIYCIRTQEWYGTPINRSCALNLSTYPHRLMASTQLYSTTVSPIQRIQTYPIFSHDNGYDDVFAGQDPLPIEAYYEYPIKDFFTQNPSAESNVAMTSTRFEPDFIMLGQMELYIINREFAQSNPVIDGPYIFDGNTEYIDLQFTQGRMVSVRLRSNVLGGYFEGGRNIHGIIKGASRG
jgi:hypothetical protein